MSSRVSLRSKSICVCFLYILWRKVLFHIIKKHYSLLFPNVLLIFVTFLILLLFLFFQFILPWIIHFEKREFYGMKEYRVQTFMYCKGNIDVKWNKYVIINCQVLADEFLQWWKINNFCFSLYLYLFQHSFWIFLFFFAKQLH